MALKITKSILEQIVLEELVNHIREQLNEAPPGRGTVLDDEEPEPLPGEEDEIPHAGGGPEEKLPTDSPAPEVGDDEGEVPEIPGDEEPADDDLDALAAGEEPPSEEEEGTVAGELSGKTIENITVDEDSQIMPGATEIVLSFRESPDAFRLLITKTGQIKYFYRGLHNQLDAPISPMPADDVPDEEMGDLEGEPGEEEMGGGEEPGGEEFEDMPPLGDEDMPPEEEPVEEPTSSRR
jgi:hypothetical protein